MAIVASGQLTLVDLNDSKQLIMFIGSSQPRQVIFNPNGNTYTPDYSSVATNNILTPQLFIAGTNGDVSGQATATRWYVQDGSQGNPTLITANSNYELNGITLKIKGNVLSAKASMTYICEMDYLDTGTGFTVTAKAEYEIVKITNGTDGKASVLGFLSNDSHSIPTNNDGSGGVYTSATTTMYVYNGTTDDSANWTYVATPLAGVTGALSTTGNKNVYTVSNMTVDVGYVDITASRATYPSITKRFTVTKNKAGIGSTAYWLISSAPVLQKNASNVFNPTSLTFTSKSQNGSNAPVNYNGRWVIEDTTDGTNWTVRTLNPSTDEATKTYTPSGTTIKAVRARLYVAGATTNLLDEQQINVVSDGSNGTDGVDSVTAVVWTPDGNVLRNSTGTLTAKADLYKGTGAVSSGLSYKWYYQDPSSTTAVGGGGDTDGGAGWRLMQAIANPTTAPTLNGATAGGTLTGATYYVKYTWTTVEGETMVSPEASLAVTANYNLKITIPSFPSGVSGAKVYVGTATNANKYQNVISTSGGTLTITAPINASGATPPASNTAQVDNWGVTGFGGATITIPSTSITNVESYKCIITYNSNKYTDVCTVMDVTDPILVTLVGASIFKNGTGTTTLEAKLYQNGVEIDVKNPSGTWTGNTFNSVQIYNYTWYLYDNNGAKMGTVPSWGAGSKTGKLVIVDGIDVDIRGNIVCEVSTK